MLCLAASIAAAVDALLHPVADTLFHPIWIAWYSVGFVVGALLLFINIGTRRRYRAAKRLESGRPQDTLLS